MASRIPFRSFCLAIVLSGCLPGTTASRGEPASARRRPEELKLKARPFDPPRAEDHRVLLYGRIPAYLGKTDQTPALRLTLIFKTGIWLDPKGKEGLAEAAAFMLRQGGTARLRPEELDLELEKRAIEVSARAVQDSFTVSLWSLSRESADALNLLSEILRSPRFDPDRLKLWRRRKIQNLRALHDRPDEVLRLYWRDIIWGKDHVVGRRPTRSSVLGITAEDLAAWHSRWIRPGNCIIAATSDMPLEELKALLEKHFGSWKDSAEAPSWPEFPPPSPELPAGLYFVQRKIRQGAVRLGQRGIKYGDPRLYAYYLLSEAFGGGSFQSRLVERIRTREGLTYGIVSYVIPGWIFPGTTIVQSSSKPENVLKVVELTLEEIKKLWSSGLTEKELAETKATMIARFAGRFEDLHDSLLGTAYLEYRGRPLDFYRTYRRRINSLSLREVNEAARTFLDPSRIRILVVGDMAKIREGGKKSGLAPEKFGKVTELPVRDPMK